MLQRTFPPLQRRGRRKKTGRDLSLIVLLGVFVVLVLAVVFMLQP